MPNFNTEKIAISIDWNKENKQAVSITSLAPEVKIKTIFSLLVFYQRGLETEGGPAPDFTIQYSSEANEILMINGNLKRAIDGLCTWKFIDENLKLKILKYLDNTIKEKKEQVVGQVHESPFALFGNKDELDFKKIEMIVLEVDTRELKNNPKKTLQTIIARFKEINPDIINVFKNGEIEEINAGKINDQKS